MDIKEFGRKGEELAAKHLAGLGYKVIEKNYRTPAGELDIVAEHKGTLVFVEVKARRGTSYGPPELAVNHHKRRQVERAALYYIMKSKKDGVQCRFDVVSISGSEGSAPRVTVIRDAFEISGGYGR